MEITGNLKTAREMGLVACTECMRVSPRGTASCPRCGHTLRSRDPYSLQKVWAWWLVGLGCYIPDNLYTMLETKTLVSSQSDTIVGGVDAVVSYGIESRVGFGFDDPSACGGGGVGVRVGFQFVKRDVALADARGEVRGVGHTCLLLGWS